MYTIIVLLVILISWQALILHELSMQIPEHLTSRFDLLFKITWARAGLLALAVYLLYRGRK